MLCHFHQLDHLQHIDYLQPLDHVQHIDRLQHLGYLQHFAMLSHLRHLHQLESDHLKHLDHLQNLDHLQHIGNLLHQLWSKMKSSVQEEGRVMFAFPENETFVRSHVGCSLRDAGAAWGVQVLIWGSSIGVQFKLGWRSLVISDEFSNTLMEQRSLGAIGVLIISTTTGGGVLG